MTRRDFVGEQIWGERAGVRSHPCAMKPRMGGAPEMLDGLLAESGTARLDLHEHSQAVQCPVIGQELWLPERNLCALRSMLSVRTAPWWEPCAQERRACTQRSYLYNKRYDGHPVADEEACMDNVYALRKTAAGTYCTHLFCNPELRYPFSMAWHPAGESRRYGQCLLI